MTQDTGQGNKLSVGLPVYCYDGDQLGTVKEIRGDMFKVDAPHHLDYWLRESNVDSVLADRVTMECKKEDLDRYKVANPDNEPMRMTGEPNTPDNVSALPENTAAATLDAAERQARLGRNL